MQTACQYFLEMQMLGFIFTCEAAAVFMTGSGTSLNTAYEHSPPVLGIRTKDGRNVKKHTCMQIKFYLSLLFGSLIGLLKN